MKAVVFLLFNLCLLFEAAASDFSNITLSGWTKSELASDHLKFTNPNKKDLSIHLQVDSYDPKNTWVAKTLEDDIKKMASQRKLMSGFMGINNYKIVNYRLASDGKMPTLMLTGKYTRLKNQSIQFNEINFYHGQHFLQMKIISEGELPSSEELTKLIREISPEKLVID